MAMLFAPRQDGKRVLRPVPSTPAGRPSVTAVIPAYNYARFLPECVGSILSQRGVDVRVIVVDDGSGDDTPRVTRELAADERVTVIRHERNVGQLPSVNEGLALVESEFAMKFDADDLLPPGALARATALLQAEPRVGFVYGRPLHFSGAVPRPADAPAKSWTIWPGGEWLARRCAVGTNVISQPEVVMRTAALREAGPIRTDLPHTFDLYLWCRLASLADVGRVNGPAQGIYRVHEASLQRTVHSGRMLDVVERARAFDALLTENDIPGSLELAASVHRALAASALERACRAYDRGRSEDEPVDELVDFALSTWPRSQRLPQWRALERRRQLGAARVPRHPRYVAAALARRAAEEAGRERWLRTGEW
jgi:Glycosyl transferase family 2